MNYFALALAALVPLSGAAMGFGGSLLNDGEWFGAPLLASGVAGAALVLWAYRKANQPLVTPPEVQKVMKQNEHEQD